MKLGIVSDIHCNAAALRQAIDRMDDVDELLCMGDSVYEYRFSNEVVALLRDRQARMVLGNHEWVLLGPQGERIRQQPSVDQDLVRHLSDAPYRIETRVNGGKRLLMVHGSPFEPWNTYVFENSADFKRLGELDTDYVVMGHTHTALAKRVGNVLAINPGSLGEPKVLKDGFVGVTYAVLDTETDEVRIEQMAVPPAAEGGR